MLLSEKDWIKELKLGDKVIIASGGVYQRSYIATVDKITPSGRIICGDTTFNPDGWERGGRDNWNRKYLREATPEKIQDIGDKEIISQARSIAGRIYGGEQKITVEQAKVLIELFRY